MLHIIRESSRRSVLIIVLVSFLSGAASVTAIEGNPYSPMPLNEILEIVTKTNPEILEALERYRSVKAERSIATSGYWPKVGTELSAGPEMTEGLDTNDVRENHTAATATLYARQNLYNGGKTTAFINETDARILTAAYEVLNVANRVFLETSEAYILVLKARELLKFAEENVLTQEKILEQVKEKSAAGFSRISDLNNSEARLALVRGNYISKQQDLNQAVVQFHRQFGRLIRPDQFIVPEPAFEFPATVDETVDIALRHHPALEVAKYNIQVRKYSYEKAKADYWPSLDLELEAQHRENTNGSAGETDQASAMLKFNYTFFDGGARKGEKGKNYGFLHKEYQRAYVERRNVNQTARLAWNIFQAEKHKEKFLAEHVALSAKTLEAFKDEYFVGRRTLLDLLNMENDYNSARNSRAESKYSYLIAYYRISQATGALLHEYDTGLRQQIHLPPEKLYDLKGYEELDRDRDLDSTEDVRDQCDNTASGTQTPFSGCAEIKAISVGYEEPKELSPYILPDEGTPEELNLKIDTTKDNQSIHMDIIYFDSDSAHLNGETREMLVPIAAQLKAADDYLIEVIGHTDSTGSAEHNRRLSLARALSVYDELINLGVSKERLVASGKGEQEPIATNDTEEGKRKNRRIEFKLIKKTDQETVPTPAETDAGEVAPVGNADSVVPDTHILPQAGTPEELNLKIDTTKDNQSIHMDIIYFDSDSAHLNGETREMLVPIAAQLKAADDYLIEVIGHTDSTGSAEHNRRLSLARALSVYDELINLGVSKERLVASGKGEQEPIATNDTEEGKRKNRRIEFKLQKKASHPVTEPQPDTPDSRKVSEAFPVPNEPGPLVVPEKGTPEALNLRIDKTKEKQSIHLDLIQFASDSPAITDDIHIVLKHIASQLKAAEEFSIEVVGHTDDTAGAAHNQKLSLARAQSVADQLIRLGISSERLVVSGRGEYDPITTNSTEDGKRKNRRIEFKLTKKNPN